LPGSAAPSLDGTAIADEIHGPYPDGAPFLGISFRQYDQIQKTWVIEHLNVSESFLRRQVHDRTGSVAVSGRTVTVTSELPGIIVREHYDAVMGRASPSDGHQPLCTTSNVTWPKAPTTPSWPALTL
jgi:hypothetical protein